MTIYNEDGFQPQRRNLITSGLVLGGLSLLPSGSGQALAAASKIQKPHYRVSFTNAHTKETFNGVYRIGGTYDRAALEQISYVLRDFRTGEVKLMDPQVIDLITSIQVRTGNGTPLEIISGYRSPKTNNMLRRTSNGVARKSLHMKGQAIDFRQKGTSTRTLRNIARELRVGGVGYYPRSDFIHVDTGAVRSW